MPSNFAEVFSQDFAFSGTCTGNDMVYSWSIDGKPGGEGHQPKPDELGKSFLYPWLPDEIVIVGAELIKLPPKPGATGPDSMPQYTFLMAGDNAHGDALLFLGADELHDRNNFPSGTGKPFPGTRDMTPLTYIDLHGACTAGLHALVILNLYYLHPIQ
jgi:hypothetical protein